MGGARDVPQFPPSLVFSIPYDHDGGIIDSSKLFKVDGIIYISKLFKGSKPVILSPHAAILNPGRGFYITCKVTLKVFQQMLEFNIT